MQIEKERKKPDVTATKNPGERIDRTYLCPTKSFENFYIKVIGDDGKPVPKTDQNGNPIYLHGKKLLLDKIEKFEPAGSRFEKSLCVYQLKADDPEYDLKFDALEKKKNDPSCWVMDREMYEKYKNPEAAEAKLQASEARELLFEKESIISKIEAENARLKALLEEKTRPVEK